LPGTTWIEPPPEPAWTSEQYRDPLLQAILARRFATAADAAAFLDPAPYRLPAGESLPNLDRAVRRIGRAIADVERIVIFGDYDVDGIAATAIMVQALQSASNGSATIGIRLPSRTDGYGLRTEAVREAATSGASLLIAVDCGSNDLEPIAVARSLGLDVVVFDHHQITQPGVDALIVSPQLDTDDQFRHLSASGVVYLFAEALARAGFDLGSGAGCSPRHLLDLAALGLIADVMPLTGVVRSLVRDGLEQIRRSPRPGLRAIAERAGLTLDRITSDDIAYKIAPRLNAAGRMGDPRLALGLLLTDDPVIAERRAAKLEQLNEQRKLVGDRVLGEASAILRTSPDLAERPVLVVHAQGWHGGVLGVAAARLAEVHRRPAIVLTDGDRVSRGSARSVPGFDIGRALAGSAELLIAHGGHEQAAGLTIETARLPVLAAALDAAARQADLHPAAGLTLQIDAELPIERLDLATEEALRVMEPFGAGNTRPLLRLSRARLNSYRSLGQEGRHLKLFLASPHGEVGVLAWNTGHRSRELVGRRYLDLLVTLAEDRWNGQRRLQPVLADFRVLH
jgi:single-stranded-DNA-specific exonuclease